MQPGLFIIILVLKSERLMRVPIDAFVLFQTTPGGVFAVPQQIAMDTVAVVVVAHQFLAVEGDGGEAVDVETFVFGNEIVKEQMVQTTSKKIVGSSENSNCVHAYRTHPTSGLKVLCGLQLATSGLKVLSGLRLAENQKTECVL